MGTVAILAQVIFQRALWYLAELVLGIMARRSILGFALLVLALFGSRAFISAPAVPRSAVAGGLTGLVAVQPALADVGIDYQGWGEGEDEQSGYLIGFFLIGFLGLAKGVFDAGGVDYNLGAGTGTSRK